MILSDSLFQFYNPAFLLSCCLRSHLSHLLFLCLLPAAALFPPHPVGQQHQRWSLLTWVLCKCCSRWATYLIWFYMPFSLGVKRLGEIRVKDFKPGLFHWNFPFLNLKLNCRVVCSVHNVETDSHDDSPKKGRPLLLSTNSSEFILRNLYLMFNRNQLHDCPQLDYL